MGEEKKYLVEKIPDVYVPFDFDGLNILLMEYKENGDKSIQIFKL